MYQNYASGWTPWAPTWFMGLGGVVFAIVILWSIVWKGMALWKSAREGSKVWFIVLLIVNTAGILDILYLYVFSRKNSSSSGSGASGSSENDTRPNPPPATSSNPSIPVENLENK